MSFLQLIADEQWEVIKSKSGLHLKTPYDNELGLLKLQHPALVHLNIYKDHPDSEVRLQHLKRARDYFWPGRDWHYWTERRYRAHCENWNYITLAAGASAAKSWDIGELAILFWYANPTERNVTIASVTLSSLLTRVWGYLTNHIRSMAIPMPYKYYSGQSPKVLFKDPNAVVRKNEINDDTLHGIFAVTAKSGDSQAAVATWIGKHPKDKILLILDECTDMPMTILDAVPNLNATPEKFQLIGIGNSKSTMDLHGILSTPKNGWDSVSPEVIQWDTTQKNGTCLYFSPYDSPAIHEEDEVKRARLSKYLISADILKEKEEELGTDSEKFYRWVLGFWKSRNTEDVVTTEGFLKDFNTRIESEWSGLYSKHRVAGLDPAFSTGGDKCIIRFADVGHTFDHKMRIDYRQQELVYEIKLLAVNDKSIELQIADEAIRLLILHRVPLDHLAIDITGQGRAIGEVIRLRNEQMGYPLGMGVPLKIYAMSSHNKSKRGKSVPDILPVSTYDMWNLLRDYIQHDQLCGLDKAAIYQLTNRRVFEDPRTKRKLLETKREYKTRMSGLGRAHSPDEADAAALCAQVVLERLLVKPGEMLAPVAAPAPITTGQVKVEAYRELVQERVRVVAPYAGFGSDGISGFTSEE